jgi:3-phosphoshikimate 1-carboxyvinyltransferase
MQAIITPHTFSGTVRVPPSKSHTIRAMLIASLADGISIIDYPLDSLDTRSCLSVCKALGAEIHGSLSEKLGVRGLGINAPRPASSPLPSSLFPIPSPVDVGNSGTTLFLALSIAALGDKPITFTGDEQIRKRTAANLLRALAGLGAHGRSAPNGCAPITVQGPWRGGRCSIECPTSQYLSALLLAAPLAPDTSLTEIDVPLLNEKPYIEMTLSYLDRQGIAYEKSADLSYFSIRGGQSYKPVTGPVSADFSSAAFPAAAAVVSGGSVTLTGLDPADPQGDKAFFDMLKRMGCAVEWKKQASGGGQDQWALALSRSGPLRGGIFDLNATPDLLPVMAVAAAYAEGETALVNVAHARIKETDRIAVMAAELGKFGVRCTERPDGLVVQGGAVHGGLVDGHGDHRVVMALAVAGLGASTAVEVSGAEAADVTYPGFVKLIAR